MLDIIRDLFSHMEWADERVWCELRSKPSLSSDEAIIDLLAHIHKTQHAFLDLWKDRPVKLRERSDFSEPADIAGWACQFHAEATDLLHTISPQQLTIELSIPWARFFRDAIGRDAAPVTIGESLVQVAMHSAHHRAQAVRQFRLLGSQPPMLDYIAWIWMGRPAPQWPTPA